MLFRTVTAEFVAELLHEYIERDEVEAGGDYITVPISKGTIEVPRRIVDMIQNGKCTRMHCLMSECMIGMMCSVKENRVVHECAAWQQHTSPVVTSALDQTFRCS